LFGEKVRSVCESPAEIGGGSHYTSLSPHTHTHTQTDTHVRLNSEGV